MDFFKQLIGVFIFLTCSLYGQVNRLAIENAVDDSVTAAEAVQKTQQCPQVSPQMTKKAGQLNSHISAVDQVAGEAGQLVIYNSYAQAAKTPAYKQVTSLRASSLSLKAKGVDNLRKEVHQHLKSAVRMANAAVSATELVAPSQCVSSPDDEVSQLQGCEEQEGEGQDHQEQPDQPDQHWPQSYAGQSECKGNCHGYDGSLGRPMTTGEEALLDFGAGMAAGGVLGCGLRTMAAARAAPLATSGFNITATGKNVGADPANLIKNGKITSNDISSIIPKGTKNTWDPENGSVFKDGFKYEWTHNGTKYHVHGHTKDMGAPIDSNAFKGPTVRVKIGNRWLKNDGTTTRNTGKYANDTHIPLD